MAAKSSAPLLPDIQLDLSQRQQLDQIFMQVILDTQAQIQQSKPLHSGNLAAMFHKEQLSEALQGCAALIAGWNAGRIDRAAIRRSATALRGLEQQELAERLEKLVHITEP